MTDENNSDLKRTVIVGLGNPLLSDDGVGIKAARELKEALAGREDIRVVELYAGGMELMEAYIGCDRAILVDAMVAGGSPGTVYRRISSEMSGSKNSACAHNTDLNTAMDLGKGLGFRLPAEVEIWGIEPAEMDAFGEKLTAPVESALPDVVEGILASVGAPASKRRTA